MLRQIISVVLISLAVLGLALMWSRIAYEMSGAAAADQARSDAAVVENLREKYSILPEGERAALKRLRSSAQQARPIAEAFVRAVREGQPAAAYDMTSAAFQSQFDAKTFNEFLQSHPVLSQSKQSAGGFSESTNGKAMYHVNFRGTGDGRMGESFTVIVIPEADGFRIGAIRFDNKR